MAQQFFAALIALSVAWAGAAWAASAPLARPVSAATPIISAAPDWKALKPPQQAVLAPLNKDWNSFSSVAKRKWLGIADRYPSMTPKEQANLRERMADWAKLTSEQREKARTQYKKLRTVPLQERRELEKKWQEYDALPAEQKQRLKQTPKSVSVPTRKGMRTPFLQPPKPVAVVPPAHRAKPAVILPSKPVSPAQPAGPDTLLQSEPVNPAPANP